MKKFKIPRYETECIGLGKVTDEQIASVQNAIIAEDIKMVN